MAAEISKPLLTIPPAPKSIHITPEMIEKAKAAQAAQAKSADLTPKTAPRRPYNGHISGQQMVLGATSHTVRKNDQYRYYFEAKNGKIDVYYSGKYCYTLDPEETSGVLTGLINLILENLPCNYYEGGAVECDIPSLRNYWHNITHAMCQFAEWCDTNESGNLVAINENNLYSYDLNSFSNNLDRVWEPFSPSTLLKTQVENSSYPVTAIELAELQRKLLSMDTGASSSDNIKDLLVEYFGESYINKLSNEDYFDLLDELYVSGLSDNVVIADDDQETPHEIIDEYTDFYHDNNATLCNPYSESLKETCRDYIDEECVWYPEVDVEPEDETFLGVYNSETNKVELCYIDMYGYPVDEKSVPTYEAFPAAFMDVIVDVPVLSQTLVSEIPQILTNIGLLEEIGPSVRSITAANLYAVLATDPNILPYNAVAGAFTRISFGTKTSYTAFRKLLGNIISQLLGINNEIEDKTSIVYAEVTDIMEAIYTGVDTAIYAAYLVFRRNYIAKNSKKTGISI